MENVNSMDDENKNIISNTLNVQPIMISSALLSAQNRKRLYWVGRRTDACIYETIPVTLPEDKHIYLSDIMEKQVDEKYYLKNQEIIIKHLLEKHSDKIEVIGQIMRERGGSPAQADRIYDPMGKSATLSALSGGLGAKTGLYLCLNEDGSNDNLVFALTETRTEEAKELRRKIRQETGKDFSPRRGKELQPRTDGKSNCITATIGKEHYVFQNVRIRRLTPLETERLQGFEENWTAGFSDSVRYKGTGNAVTVPVIEHILKFLPNIA
jgi:DNA (cytosine-5)-methyltransferase 3A